MILGRKRNEPEEDVSSAPGHPRVSSPGQGKGKEKGEQLAGKVLQEPGYLSLPVLQSKGAMSSTSQAQHGDSRVSLCPGRQRRQHLPTGRIRCGSQTLTPHLLQPGIPPPSDPKALLPFHIRSHRSRRLSCPPPLLLPPFPVGVHSTYPPSPSFASSSSSLLGGCSYSPRNCTAK